MKLSMRWLNDYLPYPGTAAEFAEGMTMSGSKVEGYRSEGDGIEQVVIGRVLSTEPHPDADKLTVCRIDVAQEKPIQIITSATNVFAGALVPVCLSGGRLPDGTEIHSGKLRGLPSDGMMCGLSELGLSVNDFPYAIEDGIFVIEEECAPGQRLQEAIGLCDTVVDFEITSNRPDCLSVIGLAREGSATFSIPLTLPKLPILPPPVSKTEDFSVLVKSELCSCYLARRIDQVKIAPSPRWLRERLRASGIRPINNLVDITNFVMLEYGRPMHAFDASVLQGNELHVRTAQEGETITTLDGVDRKLPAAALVIADAHHPVAVAGVMGGEDSEIRETTTEVVLESACFDGGSVRMTAKALGLRTESSARFEKGLRPDACQEPLARACQLIEELGAGGVKEPVYGVLPDPVRETVPFDPEWINRFLSLSLSREEMERILMSLGFAIDGAQLVIPNYRTDIHNKADVAEEIARIYGYNRIPSTLCRGETQIAGRNLMQTARRKMDFLLRAAGCNECYSDSFMCAKTYDALLFSQDDPRRESVSIQNPIGQDASLLRTTALPSLLSHLSRNYKNRNEKAWLYEIGRVFHPQKDAKKPEEKTVIAVGMYGGCDFYTIKGIAELLLGKAFGEVVVLPIAEPPFHTGRAAKLVWKEQEVGRFGEVHPKVAQIFDIRTRAYLAEFDFETIVRLRQREIRYQPLPKYPSTIRDLSILCDKDVPAAQVEQAILKGAGDLLDSIRLFDLYQGKQIPAGKKSLSFTVTLREQDRTITDETADGAVSRMIEQLKLLGAQLREM